MKKSSILISFGSGILSIGIVAYLLSALFEGFFLALAAGGGPTHASLLGPISRVFGFFFLLLLGTGALVVPLGLMGLMWPYSKSTDPEGSARTFLLIVFALLSVGTAFSLLITLGLLTHRF